MSDIGRLIKTAYSWPIELQKAIIETEVSLVRNILFGCGEAPPNPPRPGEGTTDDADGGTSGDTHVAADGSADGAHDASGDTGSADGGTDAAHDASGDTGHDVGPEDVGSDAGDTGIVADVGDAGPVDAATDAGGDVETLDGGDAGTDGGSQVVGDNYECTGTAEDFYGYNFITRMTTTARSTKTFDGWTAKLCFFSNGTSRSTVDVRTQSPASLWGSTRPVPVGTENLVACYEITEGKDGQGNAQIAIRNYDGKGSLVDTGGAYYTKTLFTTTPFGAPMDGTNEFPWGFQTSVNNVAGALIVGGKTALHQKPRDAASPVVPGFTASAAVDGRTCIADPADQEVATFWLDCALLP